VAPVVVAGSLKALEILQKRPEMVKTLAKNTHYFREEMTRLGFNIKPGIHPIVPIILGDEQITASMARELNHLGVFVVGFSYPVVPKGQARIRVQISAAHLREQLDYALESFAFVGRKLGIVPAGRSSRSGRGKV
jgi:glycine C-acetyltransferase